jgi:TusA-related sulfurtransferase
MFNNVFFEDAQALRLLHPETFDAPSYEDLQKLKKGDIVKVCVEGERFWSTIKEIHEDDANTVVAIVDNDLVRTHLHGIKYKDELSFHKNNIYSIFKD